MESNYRNREFEQYIKENADQYRMFPSEKVWKGIHNTLHTRRRWYGVGLALLLLVTGSAVTWVMMSYPVAKNEPVTSIKATQSLQQKSTAPAVTTPEAVTKVPPFNNKLASIKAAPGQPSVASPLELPAILSEGIRSNLLTLTPAEQPAGVTRIDRMQLPGMQKEVSDVVVSGNHFYQSVITNQDEQAPSAVFAEERIKTASSDRPNVREQFNYPLGFEDVTHAYIPQKISRKVSWQFFVTPTISYRKLDENKQFDSNAGFPFASQNDVNKAVTHKPDMGLQIGLSARYPVTRNLRITGGLQFNLNRYDIKAFAYNPEVATIELNGTNGNSSVSTWTEYRTIVVINLTG